MAGGCDGEVKAIEAGGGEDGGVEFGAFGEFFQAGDDVAAEFDNFEVGTVREDLGLAAGAAGGEGGAAGKVLEGELGLEAAAGGLAGRPFGGVGAGFLKAKIFGVAINQNVAGVGSFADGAEGEAGREFSGEVLEAVDGEIGAVLEQGDFEFFGEK